METMETEDADAAEAEAATCHVELPMDIGKIMSLIPHRYPFLLIDRVLDVVPLKSCVAMKNVTVNEPFFMGHFPGAPIMPGVLLVEAMAQAGVIMVKVVPKYSHVLALFRGVDDVRFKRPVLPGDQLLIEVEMVRFRRRIGKARGTVKVGGDVACQAELTFALTEPGYPYHTDGQDA